MDQVGDPTMAYLKLEAPHANRKQLRSACVPRSDLGGDDAMERLPSAETRWGCFRDTHIYAMPRSRILTILLDRFYCRDDGRLER